LSKSGGAGWDEVRGLFPDVPPATFWRWVRAARVRPSAEQLGAARTLLTNVPGAAVDATAPLPAPVPAAALIEGGVGVLAKFDFMRAFGGLTRDADLLRSFSLSPDMSKLRMPRMFLDSARLRVELLKLWLAALPVLYSAERTQELYDAVVAEIAACDPVIARRIVGRLRELSARKGFALGTGQEARP
jgi:hypothetical protein